MEAIVNLMVTNGESKGSTALCFACQGNIEDLEIVDCLLNAQVIVPTLLHPHTPRLSSDTLAKYNKSNVHNGQADVNLADSKHQQTPLHLACKNKHIEIVEKLLSRNANPKAKNTREETPLHLAADELALAVIPMLLEKVARTEPIDTNS